MRINRKSKKNSGGVKRRCAAAALGALVLCLGASIWEGAAAVGLGGELPEGGFYVATKSFPRNTMVDVTNLENGKTIRAIVASTLDSPGLLTVLSRETADSIGLSNRSIGRVRMTMPSDPVAFSRFTEGLGSSGDPDFDPQASIAANSAGGSPETSLANPDPGTSLAADPEVPDTGAVPPPPMTALEPYPDPWTLAGSPWVYPDPGVSESPVQPLTNDSNKYDFEGTPAGNALADNTMAEAYEPPPILDQDDSVIPEPAPALAWARPEEGETLLTEPSTDLFNTLPAIQNVIAMGDAPEVPPSPAPVLADPYGFSLIPAPERPPEGFSYAPLPPEAEIPPLKDPSPVSESAAEEPEEEVSLDPTLFVDPIPRLAEGTEQTPPPAEELPSEKPQEEAPENTPEEPAEKPANPNPPPLPPVKAEPAPRTAFSVPVISRLEQGKYYVQLGAFSRPDVVESEISRIGQTYPLTVQTGENPEKPLYRILLGPVNLGESGALLLRFRGNGFSDAFIRQDG
jgi:cell division septation protein DedD